MSTFSDLGLSSESLLVLQELGFTSPTAIQRESIPPLLAGRDLVGQSKTGSGKTAAFTLPMLQKITLSDRKPGARGAGIFLQGLILCPTRELSTQVATEVRKLGRRYPGLKVITLTGGVPFPPQRESLEHGVHIVVGTPGRVLDHLTRRTIDFSRIKYVVLDEADRMLEMGFSEDMEAILAETPKNAQMLLFSATFPPDIVQVSAHYQNDPVRVTVESTEDDEALSERVDAFYHFTSESAKVEVVLDFLRREKPESTIVFCNLKKTAAELGEVLTEKGFPALSLHGDLEQRERDQVMVKFRNGSRKIMVATDVAARGIDVSALSLVVNFDFPISEELFIHRVGRTGRAGKKGLSLLLVTPKQESRLPGVEAAYGSKIKPYDFLVEATVRKTEEKPARSTETGDAAAKSDLLSGHWETLQILGGRKDKLRPGDILGALTGEAGGLHAAQVGKIEIQDKNSFVAVDAKCVDRALKGLIEGRLKGRKFRVSKL